MKQKPTLDLWGQLPVPGASRTPADMLREQADALDEKTKGVLIGSLEPQPSYSTPSSVCIRFVIQAPALEYRTSIFEVEHNAVSPYPCVVRRTLAADNSTQNVKLPTANSEPELAMIVGDILQSSEVRQIIAGLLETSRVTEKPKERFASF